MDNSDFLDHENKLLNLCRICGKLCSKKNYPVLPYHNEINIAYKISVLGDNHQIHPTKLCQNCRNSMFRLRKAKQNNEKIDLSLSDMFIYCDHDKSCAICERKRGEKVSTGSTSHTFDFSTVLEEHINEPPPKRQKLSEEVSEKIHVCISEPGPSKSTNFENKTLMTQSDSADLNISSEPKAHFVEHSGTNPTFRSELFNAEITSFDIDRVHEKFLGEIFSCPICKGVPSQPVITECSHIFCRTCALCWLDTNNQCPVCRAITNPDDLDTLKGQLSLLYDSIHLSCQFNDKGCKLVLTLKTCADHERTCKFGKSAGKMLYRKFDSKPKYSASLIKEPIYDCQRKYVRHKRLKPVIDFISNYCSEKNENKCDVLFFALCDALRETNDSRMHDIEYIWRNKSQKLSPDECLAMRVDCLQSKSQYKHQYFFLKDKGFNPLQPLSAVNAVEYSYMPQSVRYTIQGQGDDTNFYHTPAKMQQQTNFEEEMGGGNSNSFEPIDILGDFHKSLPEIATPNIKGVRWSYPDALAKTLHELEPEIISGLELNKIDPHDQNLVLISSVKDGADGMGDISVHKEQSDRFLPDKAFRFSFCVFKIEICDQTGKLITIFNESKPNSVRTNRPLLESICDENNHGSSCVCLLPIENERNFLKNKILKINTLNGWRKHSLKFYNSMIDEKLDRADAGLMGSGSRYLCTLCEATREGAKTNLGTFCITRTYEQTSRIANYLKVNPDNLSKAKLDSISLGVKSNPLLYADAVDKGIDATHADINCGLFFRKLIIKEIANVTQWDVTSDIKEIIKNSEHSFDLHMKKTTGINPQLMLPGNYARNLFDEKNEMHVLGLILNDERRENLSSVLRKFRFMRKIYRANKPLIDFLDDVNKYKVTAVEMGRDLIHHFDYAVWPNYIHKIIEHVQELIQRPDGPGTVGGLSGEGNEGGNKIFRHFRKNLSRKGNTQGGLRDVLWLHWLYSSPALIKLSEVEHKKNKCSVCFQTDHNRSNCPNKQH